MTVLCTAGHVDHGKSALVKALTGTDPDRLAEEKGRGMTIELGFVEWRLRSGRSISLIDVPGHRSLIRTMAAGAHAVDGVILVAAAPEGIMPQTREHLAICQLLGPRPIVGVVSMTDRSDAAVVSIRLAELEQLAREFRAEVLGAVACSAVTGEGLDSLGALVQSCFPADQSARTGFEPRLHIDRAFGMTGRGLVVTGTLIGGCLQRNEAVEVLPDGCAARIRQIERHGQLVDIAQAGSRTALNLQGPPPAAITRGQTLVRPGSLRAYSTFGVSLRLLPGCELKSGRPHQVMLHHGTRRCTAGLRTFGSTTGTNGMLGFAELASAVPIAALPGDRFLLRTSSSDRTLGGGTILDLAPAIRRQTRTAYVESLAARGDGETDKVIAAEVDRAPEGAGVGTLCLRTGLEAPALGDVAARLAAEGRLVRRGDHLVSSAVARQVEAAILETLAQFHRAAPFAAGMEIGSLLGRVGHPRAPQSLDHLAAGGQLRALKSGLVALEGWVPDPAQTTLLENWVAARGLEPAAAAVVRAAGYSEGALHGLAADGRVVRVAGGFVARSSLEATAHTLLHYLAEHGPSPAGELCRTMGVPRRVGIPLLEWFDAAGVTRRVGTLRTAGREREGNDPSEDAASAPPDRFEDGGAHLDPSAPGQNLSRPARPAADTA